MKFYSFFKTIFTEAAQILNNKDTFDCEWIFFHEILKGAYSQNRGKIRFS